MHILAINGSPRPGGNTELLLDKALEGAASAGASVKKIAIQELDISPCSAAEYDNVDERGLSVVKDDIYAVFDEIGKADALVLGSPVYFGSITAQLKTVIDRFQCVWIARNRLGKKVLSRRKRGAFICTAGSSKREFFDNSEFIVRQFFALINTEYKYGLFCPGIDEKGGVAGHPDFLEEARDIGRRIAS